MKKILMLSVLAIVAILFTAQLKRGFVSLLILMDSVRPAGKSVMGKLIEGPTVDKVAVPSGNRLIQADLYRPIQEGRRFPLLLVHGVNSTGKENERLVLLAKDLARAGFLVLVPEFKGMKSLRIRISDAEDILQSFLYLIRLEHARPRGGMMSINYGAGPLLLAAADPRIRDKVGVVATFGGYYDIRTALLFAMTGSFEYVGHRGYLRPDEALRWMFAYRNVDLVPSTTDQDKLRKIIEKRNRYEMGSADALAKSLGSDGRALYEFLINSDAERFAPLYEGLPFPVREYFYQLSTARAIPSITASFIIVHGTDDAAVPYTESMRLADAVGDNNRVLLALLPQFMHGEPRGPSASGWFNRNVLGGWRLFTAIYELVGRAE